MVPAHSHRVSRVPWYSGFRAPFQCFAYGAFTLSGRSFQFLSAASSGKPCGPYPGALRAPVWALSLSLAATKEIDFSFSSSGYLDVSVRRVPFHALLWHYCHCSFMDTWSLSMWVPPFRYPRLMGYLLLPAAFRSLSRLSSAPSAKASAPRPFCLTSPVFRIALRDSFPGFVSFLLFSFYPAFMAESFGCH